jgi:hypothetical protein
LQYLSNSITGVGQYVLTRVWVSSAAPSIHGKKQETRAKVAAEHPRLDVTIMELGPREHKYFKNKNQMPALLSLGRVTTSERLELRLTAEHYGAENY